jgi:transcriptional regulator with XRE-family HTH domain
MCAPSRPTIDLLGTDLGLTGRDLASALHVERRTLDRWARGEAMPPHLARDNLQRLVDLHQRLFETFTDASAVARRVQHGNRYLGGISPADAIRAGRIDRVEAAIEALDSGFAT